MQFFTISAVVALAALATALPSQQQGETVQVTLPPGCTTDDLLKCALHLVGTTGSCGAAVIEGGVNVAADLACVGSAAGTAANFDECKSCIPS